MALCTLGCPAQYSAVIHWKCGDQVYMPVENLTALTYSRTLNDTSGAAITITKDSLDDACCGQLGGLEPWLHELSIYRDSDLVWQGPIITVTETRSAITIEAADVTAWLARLVNFSSRAFRQGEQDLSVIAQYFVMWNLRDSPYSCTQNKEWPDGVTRETDHACILPYMWRENVGVSPAYKPQQEVKYVTAILEELVKFGLYFTTVGRRLILTRRPTMDDFPVATLTTEDLMGDFAIVRDGQAFATRVVATNSSTEEDRQTVTVGYGCSNPYGRVDLLVSSTDIPECECDERNCTNPSTGPCRGNADCGPCSFSRTRKSWNCDTPTADQAACNECVRECVDDCMTACESEQRAALLVIARAELRGRYPVPVSISVDNGSALHPEAPVCFDQLVPGYRFDVRIDRACRRVNQAFILSDVSVTWEAGGEKVSISLTPLDPPGDETEEQVAVRAERARVVGEEAAALWWEKGQLPPPPDAALDLVSRAAP